MEFILTLLVVFVVSGWIFKRVFPLLLAWYIKRKMKNGGFSGDIYGNRHYGFSKQEQADRSRTEEGKVTVATVEEREKVIEDDMGEYIDFEEEKE